jgi:uroporphyrinogen-III decarboxylase
MTPIERVRTILSGGTPDRPALFDLLRNNAVLEYYSGKSLVEDTEGAIYGAIRNILDSTRSVRFPSVEGEEHRPDGTVIVRRQWTTWTKRPRYPTVAEAEASLQGNIRSLEERLAKDSASDKQDAQNIRASVEAILTKLGYDFAFFAPGYTTGMMVFTSYGLETFSYLLADNPEVISRYLELNTELNVRRIEHVSVADISPGVFVGEDIAYKGGTLFSPAYLRREFMPRLERIVDAYHKCGLAVMFHSDGNLMEIVDDLVAVGVDILNPIETIAGMNVAEIRKKHKNLVFAGGIDVSQLLPFGHSSEVAAETRKLIEIAGPGVLVGSSTELHNNVPLENFKAMADTVRNYRYV